MLNFKVSKLVVYFIYVELTKVPKLVVYFIYVELYKVIKQTTNFDTFCKFNINKINY
jgi:hypothetical protein